MFRFFRNESGQITILVLVALITLLALTCLIGAIAQVLVSQQRLNSKAESVALAGAQELEFNHSQACLVAKEFGNTHFGLNAVCYAQTGNIEILLSTPNPNPFLAKILPNIYARSWAGIASDN